MSVQGTTENAVCSNRGICDEISGECRCFIQWGSSNGQNGPGPRGDCGYVEPFIPHNMLRADKRALELREIERRQAERAQSTVTRHGFESFEKARMRRRADEDRLWKDHGFTKYTWAQDQVCVHVCVVCVCMCLCWVVPLLYSGFAVACPDAVRFVLGRRRGHGLRVLLRDVRVCAVPPWRGGLGRASPWPS